jgi:hypothetical protein
MSELTQARAEALIRRQRFMATAHELQQQLRPGTIASNVVETAKAKGEAIAEDAIDAVRKRPVAASAAVAGTTALLGFGLFTRFFRHSEQDGDT